MDPIISFTVSLGMFMILVTGAGVWQYRQRKVVKAQTAEVDQAITHSAELAQRRYKTVFGRASTNLEQVIADSTVSNNVSMNNVIPISAAVASKKS
jgi:hypothetical protein